MFVDVGSVRIKGQTFIAKNITSVRAEYSPEGFTRVMGGLSLAGAIYLYATDHGFLCMFAVMLAVVFFAQQSKLFIVTAGGEAKALEADGAFVRKVHDAIVNVSSR